MNHVWLLLAKTRHKNTSCIALCTSVRHPQKKNVNGIGELLGVCECCWNLFMWNWCFCGFRELFHKLVHKTVVAKQPQPVGRRHPSQGVPSTWECPPVGSWLVRGPAKQFFWKRCPFCVTFLSHFWLGEAACWLWHLLLPTTTDVTLCSCKIKQTEEAFFW